MSGIELFEDMEAIKLLAKGSNGEQTLSITKQVQNGVEEFFFTLHGKYKGQYIQIDFDELNRKELVELRSAIDLVLE